MKKIWWLVVLMIAGASEASAQTDISPILNADVIAQRAGIALSGGNPVPVRLTALGYYYNVGTPADLPKIADYTGDKAAAPKCKADAKDCDWKCEIQTDKGSETKEIKTVGEFVEFCVKPAMEKRGAKK